MAGQIPQHPNLASAECFQRGLRPGGLGFVSGDQALNPGDERGAPRAALDPTIQELWHGVQQKPRERPIGLSRVERILHSGVGSLGITQRVVRDRGQKKPLSELPLPNQREGTVECRRQGGDRSVGFVLGELQSRQRKVHLRAIPLLSVECGKRRRSLGVAETKQSVKLERSQSLDERTERREPIGEPLGGLVGSQRLGVATTRHFEIPASESDRHSCRGVSLRPQGALGLLEPGLCLRQLSAPHTHQSEHIAGEPGRWVVGPTMPPGQVYRVLAEFDRRCERAEPRGGCLVSQAGELEVRPTGPACQLRPQLQVAYRVLELAVQYSVAPRLIRASARRSSLRLGNTLSEISAVFSCRAASVAAGRFQR